MPNFAVAMIDNSPYLDFLRYCVDDTVALPMSVNEIKWGELYQFARKQAVEAVYWRGIERMDRENGVKLTDVEVLAWMARVQKIERRSKKIRDKVKWVWKNFQKEGFRSCLLKGHGNALLYPEPYMRPLGDIDIWVEGGDRKVIAYVDSIKPGFKRVYHHIDFFKFDKISVEVHYRPSWMSSPIHNRRLQHWFEEHGEACFSNFLEDEGFCIPTYEFNVVYQLSHIYSHLLREGVGLRHIVDYYYLMRSGVGKQHVPEHELRHLGLRKIAGAVSWVLHEILGLDGAFLLCSPDEKRGRLLLTEILEGGNFGKHDERALSGKGKSHASHNLHITYRDFRLLRYFPSECLWEPWFRVWHYFWRKRH